jgi:hypothetical protein
MYPCIWLTTFAVLNIRRPPPNSNAIVIVTPAMARMAWRLWTMTSACSVVDDRLNFDLDDLALLYNYEQQSATRLETAGAVFNNYNRMTIATF